MSWFGKRSRTRGLPTSANRASSMHLHWNPAPAAVGEVSAVLEVVEPPVVARLYFWALQVSFVDRGRRFGSAHLGLQWHPGHPSSTAVNWGGYHSSGGQLEGDASSLPSATGNPNTRDYPWAPGREYRLRISGSSDGWWAGEVTDLTSGVPTLVRRLHGGGGALAHPVVWSEVFARCDDPSVVVRWSEFDPLPHELRPTYQSVSDGGCSNTRSAPDTGGWIQQTNTDRDLV